VDGSPARRAPYAERWFERVQPALASVAVRCAWLAAVAALGSARLPQGPAAANVLFLVASCVSVIAAAIPRVPALRRRVTEAHARAARAGLDRSLRERLPRAEALAASGVSQGESGELAALHLERTLALVDWASFDARMDRVASRLKAGSRVALVAVTALVAARFEATLEGLAVLTSRGGESRFAIPFAREATLALRPPSYLRIPETVAPFEGELVAFAGSEVDVRFAARRAGLELALDAGGARASATGDGRGAFVVRRTVAASETWRLGRIVAGVFVPDGAEVRIETAHDALPAVALEGAPRQLLLGETDREGGVPIAYEAEDDHGLREVHLVLRSGATEERRPLATLDGERRRDRGASFVRTSDPFFRKAIGPVEIRVEARDDGREGVRWGRSDAVVVVPPALGTAEAQRFAMLLTLRDREVDRLARRLGFLTSPPAGVAPWLVDLEEEREEIEATLSTSTLGLLVPSVVRAVVRREADALRRLAEALPKRDGDSARRGIVDATETLVWRADLALKQLAWSDARAVAKRIGQRVQDASDAIQSSAPPSLGEDLARLDAAARTLRTLGPLGRDLGDLVEGELERARGRLADDPPGAKFLLAVLARRLARPDPSFRAKGGGKGGASDGRAEMAGDGASGGEGAEGGEPGEGSDGEGSGRGGSKGKASPLDELAEREQSVRRGTEALGRGPSDEAAERDEHVRQLLELAGAEELRHREGEARLRQAAEAVRRGAYKEARDAVVATERGLPKARTRERAALENRLRDEIAWLDERKHGDARSLADEQRRLGDEARRARSSARDERAGQALERTAEAMDRAERALREGALDRALAAQAESLEQLEAARDAQRGEDGRGADEGAHAAVPMTEERRAAAWRKRVLEGLAGRGRARDPEAVQRYEEGLLR
jgi:hypothetical protein